MSTPEARVHCPSAQPEWKGSFAFGVVEGTPAEPRVTYLPEPVPVTPQLIQLTAPVTPGEVLRFAAPCARGACHHWGGGECRLARKVVARLEPVTSELPACAVRGLCRWFAQEGGEACLRCPRVVTDQFAALAGPVMAEVTNPAV